MKVYQRPIGRVKPYPGNPRKIPQKAINAVAASLREFGWQQPLVVDSDNVLVVGHTRLLAAKHLGMKKVPCVVAEGLTPAQVKAYRLADNKTGEQSGWLDDALASEIGELLDGGFEMGAFGFDAKDLAGGASLKPDPDTIMRYSRKVPDTAFKTGDVLVFDGRHRLICGDSRDPEVVAEVLAGAEPHLCVTDPPYGVEYSPEWRSRLLSNLSTRSTRGSGDSMIDSVEYMMAGVLPSVDVIWCWHADRHSWAYQKRLAEAGFTWRATVIWVKEAFRINQGHVNWQHEPCLYAVRKGKSSQWNGGRRVSSLMAEKGTDWWPTNAEQEAAWLNGGCIFARSTEEKNIPHATQKPVECMARPIRFNSKPGDAVWEPFMGSGTTLIAAERYQRVCYGAEIDPVYCEIIRRRWADVVGTAVEVIPGG